MPFFAVALRSAILFALPLIVRRHNRVSHSIVWLALFLVLRFLVLLFFLFVSALIHIGGAHKFRQCSALHTQKHSHRPTLFYQFYYITRPCVRWKFICTFGYEAFAFLLLHFSFVFFFFFAHIVCWSSGRFNVATVVLFFRMSSLSLTFFRPCSSWFARPLSRRRLLSPNKRRNCWWKSR